MGPRPHPEFRLFVSASDVPPAGKEVGFEADERTLNGPGEALRHSGGRIALGCRQSEALP